MKLRPDNVVPRNDRGEEPAVLRAGDEIGAIGQPKMVAVNKVSMRGGAKPGEDRVRFLRLNLVPSHMRDLQIRTVRLDRDHVSADPAEAFDGFEFAPDLRC